MSRLTKRDAEGNVELIGVYNLKSFCIHEKFDAVIIKEALEKLAAFEDSEEQKLRDIKQGLDTFLTLVE